jgi:hypothetical protein
MIYIHDLHDLHEDFMITRSSMLQIADITNWGIVQIAHLPISRLGFEIIHRHMN